MMLFLRELAVHLPTVNAINWDQVLKRSVAEASTNLVQSTYSAYPHIEK